MDRVRTRLVEVERPVVDPRMVGRHLLGVADVRLPHLDETAALGEQCQRGVDELVREGVQDDIHTATARGVQELLHELQIPRRCQVRIVQSQTTQGGPLGRARGAVYLGTGVLRELDRGHPDTACRGVDEYPLPFLEPLQMEERVIGGEVGARHGRGLGVAPPVGDGHEHAVIRDGHTAEGAGEDPHHAVARCESGDVVRDLQHGSGALAADPVVDGRPRHQSQGDRDVPEVEPRGVH